MTEKYLQITYYTLTGLRDFIEIGDHAYGEWIVYEDRLPKYHVRSFDQHPSNALINYILLQKKDGIESIVAKISSAKRIKLSLDNRPVVRFFKEEKLVSLDLGPLPESWVKQIAS